MAPQSLARTAVLSRCSDDAQETFRALMADYGVSFTGLIDSLGMMLRGKNLTDPDLVVHLRPWIVEARRHDALRRRRPMP